MPSLPGLTLSQEHYDRVVASFPGATLAEKAEAYENWLVNRLIERVHAAEARKIDEQAIIARNNAMQQCANSLPPRREEPPLP